jgi:hypothetical protein
MSTRLMDYNLIYGFKLLTGVFNSNSSVVLVSSCRNSWVFEAASASTGKRRYLLQNLPKPLKGFWRRVLISIP